ncbi:MAG: alpha-galactosidase [Bacteroidales bacterium]
MIKRLMCNILLYSICMIFSPLSVEVIYAQCDKETAVSFGAPENAPASVSLSPDGKRLTMSYNGGIILNAEFTSQVQFLTKVQSGEQVEQTITIKPFENKNFKTVVYGSSEALAAETRGNPQKEFPLVRTSHGLSNNLRNNAVYDRNFDWMLEAPEGTKIQASRNIDGTCRFDLSFPQNEVEIIFRPRYYQMHKNLAHFQPWTYKVYKDPIMGWSSWWAFFREFNEETQEGLLDIWEEKHFADYGYRFIQIDDVFQGEFDKGRENCKKSNGYFGGRPTTWLDWKKDLFPGGLTHYVSSVKKSGFAPAVWMGCFFSDEATVNEHPDWFVKDASGKPMAAPWVGYTMDATKDEVVEALIRPVFKGFKNAGIEYVKIDQLRHLLYDCVNNNLEWCEEQGIKPDDLLRAYLRVAREEMGDKSFILSCWGVLPESIGLVDACRIGGDGYGPVTMQQYNSWNGIVWRNDPDHCDVLPKKAGQGAGNITKVSAVKSVKNETIIRPALASIAGVMLLLSDKPEVYTDDDNLHGLRRSSPVLFSVPGQLYDYDPQKSDWLKTHLRTEIVSGAEPAPCDADQFGAVCPFWLNEFNTDYENWAVLHRINWAGSGQAPLPETTVSLSDLGLDPSKEYLVYEFWRDQMLGVVKNSIQLSTLLANGIESWAIREKLDRPQLVSTNRHLSQGAAEIEMMIWHNKVLNGRSRVIVDDEYVMTFYMPEEFSYKSASINGNPAEVEQEGKLLKLKYTPTQTSSMSWQIQFIKTN